MAYPPISTDDVASAQVNIQPGNITVTDGTNVRVILGAIGGLVYEGTGEFEPDTYGLLVVSADGSTSIVDGTSNMFKIAADGTTSLTQGASGAGSVTVTLSALGGGYTETPAYLAGCPRRAASAIRRSTARPRT